MDYKISLRQILIEIDTGSPFFFLESISAHMTAKIKYFIPDKMMEIFYRSFMFIVFSNILQLCDELHLFPARVV